MGSGLGNWLRRPGEKFCQLCLSGLKILQAEGIQLPLCLLFHGVGAHMDRAAGGKDEGLAGALQGEHFLQIFVVGKVPVVDGGHNLGVVPAGAGVQEPHALGFSDISPGLGEQDNQPAAPIT